MMTTKKNAGFALIEVMVVGSFLAVAALGLSGAMISGITLEGQANDTMSRVATAENLMEEMRAESQTNFNGLTALYHDRLVSEATAEGYTSEKRRQLKTLMSLKESELPGVIDLNGNGITDDVTTGDAKILVLDLSGENSLRLRTVFFDIDKLSGIMRKREDGATQKAVTYGETRDPEPTGETGDTGGTGGTGGTGETGGDETPPSVTVTSSASTGKGAEIVVANGSSNELTPVKITVVPEKLDTYLADVSINGSVIRTFDPEQSAGAITIDLTSPIALAPGEGTISLSNFQKWDKKKSTFKDGDPRDLTVTIEFSDGSTMTVFIAD